MKTVKNSNRSTGFKTVQKLMAAVLFAMILLGCSKDDAPGDPTVNKVTFKSMTPNSPANLVYGERVTITYDYEVADPDGVRIWLKPFTKGAFSPNGQYIASPLFKGKGTKTTTIVVLSGNATTVVDQVQIVFGSADASTNISESFENVNFTYSN